MYSIKAMLTFFIVGLFAFLLTGCAGVNPAIELRKNAVLGNSEAMHDYAFLALHCGDETAVINRKSSLEYFLKSAKTGNAQSGVYAGMLQKEGVDIDSIELLAGEALLAENISKLEKLYQHSPNPEAAYLLAIQSWENPDEKAKRLMNYSAKMLYYPAIIAEAELVLRDTSSSRKHAAAINQLRYASNRGYAAADYLLSQALTKNSDQYLQRAALKMYPQALYTLGKNRRDEALVLAAAQAGYGDAIFELTQLNYFKGEEERFEALKVASARGVDKAVFELLERYLNDKKYASGIGLALCYPKISQGYLDIFDNNSGLYYVAKLLWQNEHEFAKLSEDIYHYGALYLSGVKEASLHEYSKAIEANPYGSFLNADWAYIVQNRLPGAWQEVCFNNFKAYDKTPAYWLSYALMAASSGQGEASFYGVYRLKNMPLPDEYLPVISLIEANSYMLLGDAEKAYGTLLAHGEMDDDNVHLKNLVQHFLPTLLLYPERFKLATNLTIEATGNEVEPQEFYNVILEKIETNQAVWGAPVNMVEVPLQPMVIGE